MKTSFYFFFWIIVYFLFDLTGNAFLIQNGFVVALILVFILARLDRKLFAPELIYQNNLNLWYVFEIFYSNDGKKMAKILKNQCIGQTVMAVYCLLTVAGLLALGSDDIFTYVIFGFFGIAMMIASSKTFSQYRSIKEEGLPDFGDSPYAAYEQSYMQYCEQRQIYTAKQLVPKAPKMSKWVNIASIVFAVACLGGGLFYLIVILFGVGKMNLLFSAMLIWAVLAVFFGAKDLIDSIRGLKGIPTPTLK